MKRIIVEIMQRGEGTPLDGNVQRRQVSINQEYIYGHCFNKLCSNHNKRVSIYIESTVKNMIANGETEGRVDTVECSGYEKTRPCRNAFSTKIVI